MKKLLLAALLLIPQLAWGAKPAPDMSNPFAPQKPQKQEEREVFCEPAEKLSRDLAASSGEHLASMASISGAPGSALAIFTNLEKKTYTAVIVSEKSIGCVIMVGENWHAYRAPAPAEPDEDAE